MVRQIERQVEVFGKSASEVRQMRAEMRALAAEDQGLTEVAGRLRAANAEMNRMAAGLVGVREDYASSRGSMMQFGMQLNDNGTKGMIVAPPMQTFARQDGQDVLCSMLEKSGGIGKAVG